MVKNHRKPRGGRKVQRKWWELETESEERYLLKNQKENGKLKIRLTGCLIPDTVVGRIKYSEVPCVLVMLLVLLVEDPFTQ